MLERIITALILVAVVLGCMFATTSSYPMMTLLTCAALGAGYEWYKLTPTSAQINHLDSMKPAPEKSKLLAWAFGISMAVLVLIILKFLSVFWIIFWCASIVFWIVSVRWVRQYPLHDRWYAPSLLGIGVLLIVATITAIFSLWQFSPWWLMYVFLLVWGADSGAYFVGRKFGMRKLAPMVSPNKSIEGLIGGLLTSGFIIIVVSIAYLDLSIVPFLLFMLLSLLTVISSVLGDLVESMLKRRAGIKDSGRILPGHGGVLDRVDSLLSATPIFAAGLYMIKLLGFNI